MVAVAMLMIASVDAVPVWPNSDSALFTSITTPSSGSINTGSLNGPGVLSNSGVVQTSTVNGPLTILNTAIVKVTGQASCSDANLYGSPHSLLDQSGCDTSHSYNMCARGTIQLNAQQTSQTWCQSDSGTACPAGQLPVLVFGEFASDVFNIVGRTFSSRSSASSENLFVSQTSKCYAPGGAAVTPVNEVVYYNFGATDLCVSVKCDGATAGWFTSAQNCGVIQYSLLFTCFNPCNNCNAAGTASCSVTGSLTATCTCATGWSGY